MLGLTEYILPECSCNRMIKLYKNKKQWVEDDTYVPDMGDILFYAWKDNGVGDCELEADHVGIVKEVKNNIIYVIEGNYSKQVKIRQIKVNGKYIRGFATPDYKTASKTYDFKKKVTVKPTTNTTATNKTNATVAISVKTIASTVPYLKSGDKNEAVKVMQIVLIYLGFNCGTSGADGSFGPATVKAVKAYQKAVGIIQDGICGKDCWKNMLLGNK
nr:MAG TPA: N acetylmuramidase [Siphoviridae sp. ctngg6]DAN23159.1 MAG TPA_asm: N acetylmuramidase [Bacteriophage sp.]